MFTFYHYVYTYSVFQYISRDHNGFVENIFLSYFLL